MNYRNTVQEMFDDLSVEQVLYREDWKGFVPETSELLMRKPKRENGKRRRLYGREAKMQEHRHGALAKKWAHWRKDGLWYSNRDLRRAVEKAYVHDVEVDVFEALVGPYDEVAHRPPRREPKKKPSPSWVSKPFVPKKKSVVWEDWWASW